MTSTVNVFVRSPDTRSERRYDLGLTVAQLKVCTGRLIDVLFPSSDIVLVNRGNSSSLLESLHKTSPSLSGHQKMQQSPSLLFQMTLDNLDSTGCGIGKS